MPTDPSDLVTLGRGSRCDGPPEVVGTGGRVAVGRYSTLAAGVRFVLGGGGRRLVAESARGGANAAGPGGDISVGSDVRVGAYATLLAGVAVGDGAEVGACAVVDRDVPPYAVVAGNPARVVGHRFDPATVAALVAVRWWDWAEGAVEAAAGLIWSDRVADFLARFSPAAAPRVSVVMPVFDGARLLGRAVESLRRQTLAEWELLAVDDGSADGSAALLDALAAADARVRVFRHAANRGQAAARNTALAAARGELVAYLDQDDEFHPDHLERAWGLRDRADVLVFRYELLEERPGYAGLGGEATYDPAPHLPALLAGGGGTLAVPLGVMHRRALQARSGVFDESLGRYRGQDEDGDLWRRFAAAGARFLAVPHSSGRYHVRAESFARTRPDPPEPPAGALAVEVVWGAARHTLWMPAADAWVVEQVFGRGEYAGVDPTWLADPPTIVDVGAHCGAFALYVKAALDPGAVVHCFEPYPPHVGLLRRNVGGLAGVSVHAFGLGAADGEAELFLDPGSGAGHSAVPGLVAAPAGVARVPVRDAAAAWDELGLGAVDVLKVDCEGAEGDVLERLGPRLAGVKVALVEYHTPGLRARAAAALAGAGLAVFAEATHSPSVGVLKAARPPAGPAPPAVPARSDGTRQPRVMFASYHCYHDPASGAAVCTRDLFAALSARGWACGAFTGPSLDDASAVPAGVALPGRPGGRAARGAAGATPFAVHTHQGPGGFPVTVFAPDPPDPTRPPTAEEAAGFLAVLAEAARRFRPDVVLTYGGDAASRGVAGVARRAGARVAFLLHNFAYAGPEAFAGCDAVVVPSACARDHYRAALGVECVVLPPVIDPARVVVAPGGRDPRFLVFVNPEPAKGVLAFARLAEVLHRSRPDIPLLVVEGRGRMDWVAGSGADLSGVASVHRMANTPDPREFYRLARAVIVPSVWRESFGRVAAEALLNGVPVVASDRGALAEVVGAGGVCLALPAGLTPESRTPPSAAEVAPWAAAVARLWGDPGDYAAACAAALAAGRAWHPDAVVPRWETFLTALAAGHVAAAAGGPT